MNRATRAAIQEISPISTQQRRFRPYPAYRQSAVRWLGDVPTTWSVRRLKFLLSRNDGGAWGDDFDPEGSIVLRSTEQTVGGGWNIIEPARRSLSASERAATLLATNDLVITKSSGSELHIGKTSIVTDEVASLQCCFSNFMQRLRCSQRVLPRLLFYVLNSPVGREQFVFGSNTTTGLANLNGYVIGNLILAIPLIDEQHAIVAFLDRETARIDELIAKKTRLIELLQEKRAALVSHAVTKGLNRNALMKDSGVPWLGQVPQNWHIKQLKFAITFQRGHDLPSDDRIEGDVPIVTSAGPSAWHNQAAAKGPGIVTGRYGTIGTFHLVEQDYWPLNTTLYSVDLRGNLPRFLWYMLQTLTDVFLVNSGKSAVPGVDRKNLHPIPVAVPPHDEQAAITDYLTVQIDKLEGLGRAIHTAIEKLREYRSALISAAVTGKIDVREEATA